ncbi:MAG: hypothetical protein WD205_08420, partial [Rhodothermales bacterium]
MSLKSLVVLSCLVPLLAAGGRDGNAAHTSTARMPARLADTLSMHVRQLTRDAIWEQVGAVQVRFDTYHPQ